MEFFQKTVGDDSIVYTIEFINSIKESKMEFFNYYGRKGYEYAEELVKLGLVDFHAFYAFRRMGNIILDDFYGDIFNLIEAALLTIDKCELFRRIEDDFYALEDEDITMDTHSFLNAFVLFFYNAYRDLEGHI